MNLCIATYAPPNGLRIITDPNKQEYSKRHGYDFARNERETGEVGAAFFERHKWHLSLMRSDRWDWFYLIDDDAIFTNMTLRLEDIILDSDEIIFPMDALTIQSGGMLIRNSFCGRLFLNMVVMSRVDGEYMQSDQFVMRDLLPPFRGSVRLIPQRTLGSYRYSLYRGLGGNYEVGKDFAGNDGEWQFGDFVFHVPGCQVKASVLNEMLQKVKR